jgi:hypothetical protein
MVDSDAMDQNMETIPATLPLDYLDGFGSSPDCAEKCDEPVCWGRVFPLGASFAAFGL